MSAGQIVPQKIVLKSTTKISLSDRFTNIQAAPPVSPVQQIRMQNAATQQATQKNRRLAMQMANRPSVQAALRLKKRSLKQRLGDTGQGAGNAGGIKSRLTLGGPQRGTPRGRGGRGRGRGRGAGMGGGDNFQEFGRVQQRLGSASSRGSQVSLASRGRGRGGGGQMRGRGQPQGRGFRGGQVRGRGFRGNAMSNRGFGGQSQRGNFRGRGATGRGGRGQFQQRGRGAGRGMRGGRGGRGRGRGRGGQGQGQGSSSKEELDTQLDAYMSKTKVHLDAELDAYMAQTD